MFSMDTKANEHKIDMLEYEADCREGEEQPSSYHDFVMRELEADGCVPGNQLSDEDLDRMAFYED
jgi:hypothetical protein